METARPVKSCAEPCRSVGEPASRDVQSGLYTRQAFEQAYAALAYAASGQARSRAVVLLSVDQFTSIHETFGQPVWEQAVDLMGRIITAALPPGESDQGPAPHLAARYDEDRFAIILVEPCHTGIDEVVSQIRTAVDKANQAGVLPAALNISVGVAKDQDHQGEDLLSLAEAELKLESRRTGGASGRSEGGTEHSAWLHPRQSVDLSREAVILVVDDEPAVSSLIRDILAETGASILTVERADDALSLLGERPIDVLLADIHMPGLSGIDLLKQVRKIDSSLIVIMITGSRDLKLAVHAIQGGADDYLVKPFDIQDLHAAVSRGLAKRQAILGGRAYQTMLETQVSQRTSEIQQVVRHLESTYRATLKALGAALDTRDVETYAHSERVAQYALTLGRILNMSASDLTTLERGVYLHDIGKIGVPDRILLKQDKLDETEWTIMRQHPQLGHRLASRVDFLQGASKIILTHHERYDGQGYPNGLKGEAIPIGSRIFAVVDTLDAITSDRPYRKAEPFAGACEEIARYRGRQFDPAIVDAFMSIPQHIWSDIREAINSQSALPMQ
ncbi:MAG: response regulator [Nitrospirae bacterium]|nr:response regulator [Nitrospirota bacterium]